MEILNFIWTLSIALFEFSSSPSNCLEFGVCEAYVPQLVVTNLSTPYWVNKTISGCCKGFLKKGDICEPDCRSVHCVNAHCIGNNTCRCNSGYYPVDNHKCLPRCTPSCPSNMACISPNHCKCVGNYRNLNETHCEPTCSFTEEEFECINAICFAPNKCKCLEGYYPISEFQCEPICNNCTNGDCTSPDFCECHEGYEQGADGICTPICNPRCINADCVSPDVCFCHSNYEKYLKPNECLERQVIRDRQDCTKSCKHGSCNKSGACLCNYGYEMYNGKCLKICNKKCINGKCLEDQCVCPPRYLFNQENSTCFPICAFENGHDCINGDCIAPNICECWEGYKFLDARKCTCVPMCDPQCVNGICTEDGCVCHQGFYNVSEFMCIKNCSEGFMWLHDECVENFDFNFDSEEDSTLRISTEEITSFEDSSEEETTTEESETEVFEITTEDSLMLERIQEVQTSIVVILSATFVLLICILVMFYILHNHVFPKQIYFVEAKEQSSNCVYFTKQQNRQSTLPINEFNI